MSPSSEKLQMVTGFSVAPRLLRSCGFRRFRIGTAGTALSLWPPMQLVAMGNKGTAAVSWGLCRCSGSPRPFSSQLHCPGFEHHVRRPSGFGHGK